MEEEAKVQFLVSDAIDHKGRPADRTKTGGWMPATLILGIELAERLSTMVIVTNMVTYLVGTMHLPSAAASNANTNFGGTSYLLCLLGGIIADTFLGRYRNIAIFAVIGSLGTGLLTIATTLPSLRPPPCNPGQSNDCQEASGFQMGIFYLGLYVYGIGLGGIKSSVSGFGSDQFDKNYEKEKKIMTSFFDRFYIIISTGTLLSVTVLVYIQDTVGRNVGYGICSASMFLSFLLFLSGTRKYRYKARVGSPIVQIFQVLVAAIRKRNVDFPSDARELYEDPKRVSTVAHTSKFRSLDKAAIITDEERGTNGQPIVNPWRLCTVTTIEEIKMLTGLLPIWATTIMFWTVYAQMGSFSVQQASTMDRSLGRNFQIPPASYNVFMIGFVMLTLTIYDRVMVPIFKKCNRPQGLTNLQKVGIGLFFSIIAMVGAALSEKKRLSVLKAVIEARGEIILPLPVSAFFLLPQFILVGIGNGFIYAGQLGFFLTESPKGMKAIGTGLFLTTISAGMFTSTILVDIVKKVTGTNGWLAHSINASRLDNFYGLLAGLSFINLGLFLICAKRYKPNPDPIAPTTNAKDREENA